MYKITTLDRYFIFKWIFFFILSFICFYGLVLLGDLLNNLIRNKYTLKEIFMLIAFNAPYMWGKIFPICCCMASLFTLQTLTAHSELTAYMASGFTRLRLSLLLVILGSVTGIIQMLNVGYLAPKFQKYSLENFEKAYGQGKRSLGNDRFWIKSFNYIGSFTFYDAKNKTLYSPELYFFNDQFKMTHSYQAKFAYFQTKDGEKNIWKLTEITHITGLEHLDFPKEIPMKQALLELKEGPEELNNFQSDIYTLSLIRFYRFLASLKDTGINLSDYYFHFYDKWAHGIFCLIFILFPWMITKDYNQRHRGTGKIILYGLIFSIGSFGIYITQSKLMLQMGIPSIYAALLVPVVWLIYSFIRSVRT